MAVIKVFDRLPSVGDALFLVSGVKTWVRYSESAPSGGTFVGVVFHRDGHKVYVVNKAQPSSSMAYKTSNTADGTAKSTYLRKDGGISGYRGVINVGRAAAYFGDGGRTPSSNEPIPAADYADPVTRTAFNSSSYCKLLRQTYASYEAYLGEGMAVKFPQEYGCFGLPDGKTITYTYNNSAHPAFQYCAGVTYGYDGLAEGDWYLLGVYEAVLLFTGRNLSKVNATLTKFGGNTLSQSGTYWLAQRYTDSNAWFYYGPMGALAGNYFELTTTFFIRSVVRMLV